MGKPAAVIRLTDEEEKTLKQYLRAGTAEQRWVERAQVVLLASQGQSTQQIAHSLHTRPARVSKWRQRFAKNRLAGLGGAVRMEEGGRSSDRAQTLLRQLMQLSTRLIRLCGSSNAEFEAGASSVA
jgi:transposase